MFTISHQLVNSRAFIHALLCVS